MHVTAICRSTYMRVLQRIHLRPTRIDEMHHVVLKNAIYTYSNMYVRQLRLPMYPKHLNPQHPCIPLSPKNVWGSGERVTLVAAKPDINTNTHKLCACRASRTPEYPNFLRFRGKGHMGAAIIRHICEYTYIYATHIYICEYTYIACAMCPAP